MTALTRLGRIWIDPSPPATRTRRVPLLAAAALLCLGLPHASPANETIQQNGANDLRTDALEVVRPDAPPMPTEAPFELAARDDDDDDRDDDRRDRPRTRRQ